LLESLMNEASFTQLPMQELVPGLHEQVPPEQDSLVEQ
jgi:hypothetical protein